MTRNLGSWISRKWCQIASWYQQKTIILYESRRWSPDEWKSPGLKSKRLVTSGTLAWSWTPVWLSRTMFPNWFVQATTAFHSSAGSESPPQQIHAIHSFGLTSIPGSITAMVWWAGFPCSFSTSSMELWERPPDWYFSSQGWAPSHLPYVSVCTADVSCRIRFKLCVLAYRCLHGTAPVYQTRYIVPVSSVAGRSNLWSASSWLLCVPASKTVSGSRSFAISCPLACNSLPSDIRHTDLSLLTFRNKLKTYLFSDSIWAINNYFVMSLQFVDCCKRVLCELLESTLIYVIIIIIYSWTSTFQKSWKIWPLVNLKGQGH